MLPKYLSDIIPGRTRRCASRNVNNISLVTFFGIVNINYFMNTFFRLQ